MASTFDQAATESREVGPVGLISHGGPIAILLRELGIDREELAKYRTRFDSTNPLPPAGVWEAQKKPGEERWQLRLVFTPSVD
jgi:hypothetical protein